MDVSAYAIPGISISDEMIIESVSKVYGISSKNLLIPTRRRNITEPRQIALFLIIVIGRKGTRYIENHYPFDHSTADYSIKTVKSLYQTSKQYRQNVTAILDDLSLPNEDREIITRFMRSKINWNDFKSNL
ncbi:MAG: helix-turn-helix domain-containing protein [Bacteroidales bacterium]|nr:helix-turn-helix domain-containing protein [Bacteroidales bacterium]MDP3451912.1 helix-turn-helix domain-containing protein [Bacteroidales bacterium]